MKTKCMSCGGTTKKRQKGGTVKPVVKKVVPKKPVIKKVVPASPSDMKTFRLRNGYDTKGVKVESMKKGGVKK